MNAKEFIERHGRALAEVSIDGGTFPKSMRASILKSTEQRLVLAFTTGKKAFVIKQFNAETDHGVKAFLRERDGLELFSESGLVPEITHFNDKDLFVISRFVDGPSILDCITPDNCETLSLAMGEWFADFYQYAPWVETNGKWRDYLKRLNHPPHTDTRSVEAFLETMPLKRITWARGDGALSNFLIREDGTLCGIDFEKSNWHPYGWDVLLAARAFSRRVPNQSQDCIAALVEGFCNGKQEAMRRWQSLTSIFVASYLFADNKSSSDADNAVAPPKNSGLNHSLHGAV